MNCCCGGGDDVNECDAIVKEEGGGDGLCRDYNFQHRIGSDACVKLAQYPFSLPLYSGYMLLYFFLLCVYVYECKALYESETLFARMHEGYMEK